MNMPNLKYLDISENPLLDVPTAIFRDHKLKEVILPLRLKISFGIHAYRHGKFKSKTLYRFL